MGRKPTLPIVVTNEAIKKTAEKIRGFRGLVSDGIIEIALFINRQAGLLGFMSTDAFWSKDEIPVTIYHRDLYLRLYIKGNETIGYIKNEKGVDTVPLAWLTLKQAIDELKKVAPHGRK